MVFLLHSHTQNAPNLLENNHGALKWKLIGGPCITPGFRGADRNGASASLYAKLLSLLCHAVCVLWYACLLWLWLVSRRLGGEVVVGEEGDADARREDAIQLGIEPHLPL